jgi:tetratricopeptide (TPR) repeat protein
VPKAGTEHLEAQARRYRLLALVSERIGDIERAEKHCRNGLELIEDLGLPNVEAARLHSQLADVLWRRSQFDTAERACHDGLAALPPEPAVPRERAVLLRRLATITGFRGRYTEAISGLEHSLELARHTGDLALIISVLHNLGRQLYLVGQSDRALGATRSLETGGCLKMRGKTSKFATCLP